MAKTTNQKTEIEQPQANTNNGAIEHVEATPIEANALETMERASIDVQIATAHRFPRSITKFIEKATEMVVVDAETAESCIYRRPVGRDEGGSGQKFVEGESIRLAEIVAACFGNLRVGVIITEFNPRYVKAVGYAHDLENNYAVKAEVMESTVKKTGIPFSERMRVVVAKAAQSKAMRDAIFRVVPKSLCKPLVAKARQIIAGSARPLVVRREQVANWLKKLSIDDARIFAALDVAGIEEMGEDELELLTGIRTALKDNDITLDEAFPPLPSEEDTEKGTAGLAKRLKKKSNKKTKPTQVEPQEVRFFCPDCDHECDKAKESKGLFQCPKCLNWDVEDRWKDSEQE